MGLFSKDIETLHDLFLHTLQDIYYAENQITKALPKMIDKATDDGLALTVTTITRREAYDSPLANVPVLNRLTRNIGVARPKPSDKDAKVWVPAEKIGSVKVLE